MDETKNDVLFTDFDKICRLCLSLNNEIVGIFKKKTVEEVNNIIYRIRECITLEVSENDGLPQNICKQCLGRLDEYYNFKDNCKKADFALRQHLALTRNFNSHVIILSAETRTEQYLPSLIDKMPEGNIKSEKDDSNIEVPLVKVECERNDDIFSETDDKPLIEIMETVKKKKLEKEDGKLKVRKSSVRDPQKRLTRGRAPKAKPMCLICHQKFSRFIELIDHQSKMHNYSASDSEIKSDNNPLEELKVNIDACAIFKCHLCKKEFSGREDLRNHCKTVHNTKVIQPYACSHCERQFPSWGLLVVHERKHTGEKPYSCDVCGKQNFISHTSVRRHKLMHLKVYSCKECGRDFNCDSALKAHIRCKHTNEKPFLCNICGRSFSLSAILTAHMTSHSSERKYICDICGFASKTSGNHYRHKNTHKTGGAKSFHCETCGKSFDSKLKLTSHQIIHRPVRPHACKVCSKAFLYKNKLDRHILLVHARERPFPCNLCGKKLASKFGLGIHLKTHTRNVQLKLEVQEPQQVS